MNPTELLGLGCGGLLAAVIAIYADSRTSDTTEPEGSDQP